MTFTVKADPHADPMTMVLPLQGDVTGPAGVWIQLGRKVLIDLDAFEAWIDPPGAVIVSAPRNDEARWQAGNVAQQTALRSQYSPTDTLLSRLEGVACRLTGGAA